MSDNMIKGVAAIAIVFGLGIWLGYTQLEPRVETKTVYETPQACLDLIDTDTEAFSIISNALNNGIYTLTPAQEQELIGTRAYQVTQCQNGGTLNVRN